MTKNLSGDQASKYVDRLIDLTRHGHEWTVIVTYAMHGNHIFDCKDKDYNIRLIHDSFDKQSWLWVGKSPVDRPLDWRCYKTSNLSYLQDEVWKSLGLDKVDAGDNGFDVDDFIGVMNLSYS